jgi:hypothetical protein
LTPFNFLINDDIGYQNIELLKKTCNVNKNFHLGSLISKIKKPNLTFFSSFDKINSIDNCNSVCFIFSLNPKLECSVLNTRLRTKHRNSFLSIVNLNRYFSYNIPNIFINLNFSKSLMIFEGKYSFFSRLCISANSPLILIGDSFEKSGLSIDELLRYLKSSFNTIKIIKISESCNSESLIFCNIKNVTKKFFFGNIFCINSNDTFGFRKIFLKIKEKII